GVVVATVAVLVGGSLWQRIDSLAQDRLKAIAQYSTDVATGAALDGDTGELALPYYRNAYQQDVAADRVVEPLVGLYLKALRHQGQWVESDLVIAELKKRSPSLSNIELKSVLLNVGFNSIMKQNAMESDLNFGIGVLK